MTVPTFSVSRRWLWLGAPLLLFGGLAAWLMVPGRMLPSGPDAVEVAVSDLSHDHHAPRLVLMQRCNGPVMLMNWILDQKAEQEWTRVGGTTFPGGRLLNKDEGFSFTVLIPAGATACRVRVQYGLGLHGAQLWRKRIHLAWRTGRLVDALRYNEWEACESVSHLIQ